MKNILKKSYNREAPHFDNKFKPLQYPKYEAFYTNAGPEFTGRRSVLDLGCGTALFYQFLVDKGAYTGNLTGVDFAEELCRIAEARGMKTLCADAASLPFEDSSFEGVVSFTVLRIVPEQDEAILGEIRRVLVPGGLFWVSVLAKNNPSEFEKLLTKHNFCNIRRFECEQDVGLMMNYEC